MDGAKQVQRHVSVPTEMYADRANGERNRKRSIRDRLGGLSEPVSSLPHSTGAKRWISAIFSDEINHHIFSWKLWEWILLMLLWQEFRQFVNAPVTLLLNRRLNFEQGSVHVQFSNARGTFCDACWHDLDLLVFSMRKSLCSLNNSEIWEFLLPTSLRHQLDSLLKADYSLFTIRRQRDIEGQWKHDLFFDDGRDEGPRGQSILSIPFSICLIGLEAWNVSVCSLSSLFAWLIKTLVILDISLAFART